MPCCLVQQSGAALFQLRDPALHGFEIVRLKLAEGVRRFLLQRVQLVELRLTLPPFGKKRVHGLLEFCLHSGQFLLRYRAVTGRANRSGFETLKRRLLALIAQGDLLDLCRRIGNRVCILRCVLLRAALAQLPVQRLQVFVDLPGVRGLGRFFRHLLIPRA